MHNIHCSLYNIHSSQMTVMTEGIKWNKNMHPNMSCLSLPLVAVRHGFRLCQLVQNGPNYKQIPFEKCFLSVWVWCCFQPVSRSAQRCAAEWGRCGAALGFHRSCCWNTGMSHNRHPLNSPGNSESPLRETETQTEREREREREISDITEASVSLRSHVLLLYYMLLLNVSETV